MILNEFLFTFTTFRLAGSKPRASSPGEVPFTIHDIIAIFDKHGIYGIWMCDSVWSSHVDMSENGVYPQL